MKLRPRYPAQFLLAVFAAIVLWYALAAQRSENISVRGVRATLTLVNLPRDLVLTSTVPDTVALQLRGPLSRAIDSTAPIEILLDMSEARPGTSTWVIDESAMNLPPLVEVVSVEPSAITVDLERLQTRYVPVEPLLEGVPAVGFQIVAVRPAPQQLMIQGPASRLDPLEHVETTPVSVEGATGAVEATVQPRLADPLLRSLTVAPIVVTVEVAAIAPPDDEAGGEG